MKAKLIISAICLQLLTLNVWANTNDTTESKAYYSKAKDKIVEMLDGKMPLSYERAIYLIENAYLNNNLDSSIFEAVVDYNTRVIQDIVTSNNSKPKKAPTEDLWEQMKAYRANELGYFDKAKINWAIFSYMTDTLYTRDGKITKLPLDYSVSDPFGTIDWSNTQVTHLLQTGTGNCFALASLFKIFSERLNANADICTAPGHVYITHKDDRGTYYNIELTSRSFPGTGTMETLTYTTTDGVKNNVSLRQLDLKQSVALCLVYLAKGYEYKFKIKGDNFALQCAELSLKYDSLNLNAMLLKAEVLETNLLNKNKTIAQLQTDNTFKEYQHLINHLYALGYREMPVDMKNFLIKGWMRDTSTVLVEHNHIPTIYNKIGVKYNRFASLSWGVFDEEISNKPVEKYSQTLFDTKKKKIIQFVKGDVLYNDYNFDPVVFALNVDPLAHKYPSMSPYAAFANNPILLKDEDGREPTLPQVGTSETFIKILTTSTHQVGNYTGNDAKNYMKNLSNTEFDWKHMRPKPTETGVFNMKPGRYIYTEKAGWVDMAHFMFYAGDAYKYKEEGKKNPIGEAVQDGYKQELTDRFVHKASAYSYEDLPSDKLGAEFGAKYFDPKSKATFGEQLKSYLDNVLGATDPKNAPNYDKLPTKEPEEPTRTNHTTTPVYTKDNP